MIWTVLVRIFNGEELVKEKLHVFLDLEEAARFKHDVSELFGYMKECSPNSSFELQLYEHTAFPPLPI